MFGTLHLTRFFFLLFAAGVLLIGLGVVHVAFGFIGKLFLLGLLVATIVDCLLLYQHIHPIQIVRNTQKRLHLGDENEVTLEVTNGTDQLLNCIVYEGYPTEMQKRASVWKVQLNSRAVEKLTYTFIPKKRGECHFGNTVIFVQSLLFLGQRRIVFPLETVVHVYPSILQLRKYEFTVFHQQTQASGIKKIRRLGTTNEFEQIKNYVQGDDVRTINWKATSRRNDLMVNQYQDERSQAIYCIIDKSRPMQMEFNGMTVLDYAINSALVLSNIALKKGDRAGLLTFSDKMGNYLPADRKTGQLQRIHEILYRQKTEFKEANYELLYVNFKQYIKTRSLCLLYTNFESTFAMKRALPQLIALNKIHILVVVLFQNNELEEWMQTPVYTTETLIQGTVAEKMARVKWDIANELKQHGIRTLLTRPEDLTVNTINQYLELKARNVI